MVASPEPSFSTSSSAPTYRQEWVTVDDQRLGVQVYPDPSPEAPVALMWPAMGVPAGYYRPFATALHAAGVTPVVVDLRGTGASTPRPSRRCRYGFPELAGDVAAVRAALAPRLRDRRLVLVGHSLGGQACLLHLAAGGQDGVAGLALVAVGLPYWRVYPGGRGPGVLAFTETIHAVTTLLGFWPGWGFGGRQTRGVIRDWATTARTGRFPRLPLPGIPDGDADAAVAQVTTPVLGVSFARDWHTPAPSVDYLLSKLAAAPVVREHYDDGSDHFSWARRPTAVADRIAKFIHTGQ